MDLLPENERVYVEVSPKDFLNARRGKIIWGLLSSQKAIDVVVELIPGPEKEDLANHADPGTDYRQFDQCKVRIFVDNKEIRLSDRHNYRRKVWILANPEIVFD